MPGYSSGTLLKNWKNVAWGATIPAIYHLILTEGTSNGNIDVILYNLFRVNRWSKVQGA